MKIPDRYLDPLVLHPETDQTLNPKPLHPVSKHLVAIRDIVSGLKLGAWNNQDPGSNQGLPV